MIFFRSKNKKREVDIPKECLWKAPDTGRGKNVKCSLSLPPSPPSKFSQFLFFFVSLLFLGTAGYILFFSPYVEINLIFLQGAESNHQEEIENKLQSFLREKYFGFLPQNSFFYFPQNRLRRQLLENLKYLKDIQIKKEFANSILVSVTERKLSLAYCSQEKCWAVDEDGTAYMPIETESKKFSIPKVRDLKNPDIAEKTEVLKSEEIKNISEFAKQLPEKLHISSQGDIEISSRVAEEARLAIENGWVIFFSTVLPAEQSIRALQLFISKELPRERYNDVEYIDLRSENKVFWKYKNSPQEEGKEKEISTQEIQFQKKEESDANSMGRRKRA